MSIFKIQYGRFRKHHRHGANRLQEPRDQDNYCRGISSRQDRNVALMNSQEYGCLHKTCRDHTSQRANMDGGECHMSPHPDEELWASWWLLFCVLVLLAYLCAEMSL